MASDLEKKIIRQIEYYFGNHNLPRDKNLQEKIKEDADGWVTFQHMTKFNRLKQLSEDVTVLAEAMKKSELGLVEINEDGTKLRRHPDNPLPENTEERRQELTARSIYAKEFPLTTRLDDLSEFFETYGPTENIFMRKDAKKKFKGSVFVTFAKLEAVEKFLKDEECKFKDVKLEKKMLKSDYYKMKADEKNEQKQQKSEKKAQAAKRQAKDEARNVDNEMTKGALLHMKDFADNTSREDIRNLLQDYGPIAWVDFNKGDTEGYVRYDQENKAKEVLEKLKETMGEEIVLNGNKLEVRVLEGEEEADEWRRMFSELKERALKKQNSKNRQKGRYGKRPCKAKRQAYRAEAEFGKLEGKGNNDEPATKKTKTENDAANGD